MPVRCGGGGGPVTLSSVLLDMMQRVVCAFSFGSIFPFPLLAGRRLMPLLSAQREKRGPKLSFFLVMLIAFSIVFIHVRILYFEVSHIIPLSLLMPIMEQMCMCLKRGERTFSLILFVCRVVATAVFCYVVDVGPGSPATEVCCLIGRCIRPAAGAQLRFSGTLAHPTSR